MTGSSHPTIRSRLTHLVLTCVLPVWLVAGLLVYHAYTVKRTQLRDEMLNTAHAMTMVVDREISIVQAALGSLATSPAFKNDDYAALHAQALELLKSYPGADIIIADATGQQVVNSYRSFGEPLPKRKTMDTVHRIFQTGQPVVSDLFYGALTKRPMIAVDIPVFRDGKVVYDLSMTFPSDRLAAMLSSLNLPREWYGTIIDSKGVVVARTRYPERYVGQSATEALRRGMAGGTRGMFESINLEGRSAFISYDRSDVSKWGVVIGVPRSVVMEEIYRWTALAVVGAATLSLIGFLFALGIARRIARDIQALVPVSLAIGRGEGVEPFEEPLSVRETQEVVGALVQASQLLQERSRQRDAAEKGLSDAVDLLQEETEQKVRATEALLERERMLIHQSRNAAMGEMIGNIAHQWRQPLNSLGIVVQGMTIDHELGLLDQKRLNECVSQSMRLIRHMSQTVDDFRDFFRPDKERVCFPVVEVLHKTLPLIEAGFKLMEIAIEVEAPEPLAIHGYPSEFSQVILNILINAKDAFAERDHTAPRRVRISLFREEERVVLTITDNAGGIPAEYLDRIFDPYFTTKGADHGTGVGLYMSKTIIERNMGGKLSVSNVEGGAQFRIEV